MSKLNQLKDTESFIKALGSQTRLKILMLFVDGHELTVNQVTGAVGISQSTCSEHLAVLKKANLMTSRKMGKEVFYMPNGKVIREKLEQLLSLLDCCC